MAAIPDYKRVDHAFEQIAQAVDPARIATARGNINTINFKHLFREEKARSSWNPLRHVAVRKSTQEEYALKQAKRIFCRIEAELPGSTPEQKKLLNELKLRILKVVRPYFGSASTDQNLVEDLKFLSKELRTEVTKLDELLGLGVKSVTELGNDKGVYIPKKIEKDEDINPPNNVNGFKKVDTLTYEQVLKAEKALESFKEEYTVFFTDDRAEMYNAEREEILDNITKAEDSIKDRKERLEAYGKTLTGKLSEFVKLAKEGKRRDPVEEGRRTTRLTELYAEFERTFPLVDQTIFTDRKMEKEKALVDLKELKDFGALKRGREKGTDFSVEDMLQPKAAWSDLGYGVAYTAGTAAAFTATAAAVEVAATGSAFTLATSVVAGCVTGAGIGTVVVGLAGVALASIYANSKRGGAAAAWFA